MSKLFDLLLRLIAPLTSRRVAPVTAELSLTIGKELSREARPSCAAPGGAAARAIGEAGIDLIKGFEGCSLVSYPDPGTGGQPWTIGYGHTGPEVHPGQTITSEEADRLLRVDLEKFERGVDSLLGSTLVTSKQFAALVSFSFNVGLAALEKSTLLKLVRAGDMASAAREFARWNRAGGKVMPGLTRRREAERKLFITA